MLLVAPVQPLEYLKRYFTIPVQKVAHLLRQSSGRDGKAKLRSISCGSRGAVIAKILQQ